MILYKGSSKTLEIKPSFPKNYTASLGDFWIKAAILGFLFFISSNFFSHTWIEFSWIQLSKFFLVLVSIKFLWVLLLSPPPSKAFKKNHFFIIGLVIIAIALTLGVLGWILMYRDGRLLILLLIALIWPLGVLMVGWRKGLFSDQEVLYWWFFNGILWWFMITFFFRDVGITTNPEGVSQARYLLRWILDLAFNFTLPFTLLYLFLKMTLTAESSHEISSHTAVRVMKILGSVAMISLGLLALMGLPSLFKLSQYWPEWNTLAEFFNISYIPRRLSSFHFSLDLGNLLAQGFFITLAWALGKYLFTPHKNYKKTNGMLGTILIWGYCGFLLFMFVLTWTKLLIPAVFILLLIFLTLVLKRQPGLLLKIFVVIGFILVIFLNTDNRFSHKVNELSHDLNNLQKVFNEHYQSNPSSDNSLIKKLVDTKIIYQNPFILRIQHYIWGWRILSDNPLTGISYYGYRDYVIEHYLQDILILLPPFTSPTMKISILR